MYVIPMRIIQNIYTKALYTYITLSTIYIYIHMTYLLERERERGRGEIHHGKCSTIHEKLREI